MGFTVGIKYPATCPTISDVEDMHSTIIFLGQVVDFNFKVSDVLSALISLRLSAPGEVSTVGQEMFGAEHDVPVYRISKIGLEVTRRVIEAWLNDAGIYSASEYPYKPHITVKDHNQYRPEFTLGAPVLWWGGTDFPINADTLAQVLEVEKEAVNAP